MKKHQQIENSLARLRKSIYGGPSGFGGVKRHRILSRITDLDNIKTYIFTLKDFLDRLSQVEHSDDISDIIDEYEAFVKEE